GRRRAAAARAGRAAAQNGAVPLARLLSAQCRDRIRGGDARGSDRRVAREPLVGARRPAHRHGRDRVDGAQEARGLFLMDARATELAVCGPAAGTRDLLRFLACGSVDDGKSTLIGRLLAETGAVAVDQIEALKQWSRKFGSAGDKLDYALLLDVLEAEREQGITIDVAYRYFSTARRAFVVADAPGHEQYTRNMATGASNADVALILVD